MKSVPRPWIDRVRAAHPGDPVLAALTDDQAVAVAEVLLRFARSYADRLAREAEACGVSPLELRERRAADGGDQ